VELLEKILLNLNLSKYKNILEVRHICEQEFLTSALIHILTNLFDNDDEVGILRHLLKFYIEHGMFTAIMLSVQHDDEELDLERKNRHLQADKL
jgi:hypothetical protein